MGSRSVETTLREERERERPFDAEMAKSSKVMHALGPKTRLGREGKTPMNLNSGITTLEGLSLGHLRGSDLAQLRKFIALCQHWQVLAQDEIDARDRERKPKK
jgi:hypothetical protein